MERFKLWDKTSNITIMGGEVLTPDELYRQFPHIAKSSGVMLEYLGDVVGGIDSIDILKQVYDVEADTDEEAFDLIVDAKLNPKPPFTIEEYRANKITESKEALNTYLVENPMLWVDGKHYSATAEKQSLLNNALAVYQLAVQTGQTSVLKWNATGEECTEWAIEDLSALALAIAEYVAPLVSAQQALEIVIKACESYDEVDAIEIDYSI